MVPEEFLASIREIVKDELTVQKILPPKYLTPFIKENEVLYIYKPKKVSESEPVVDQQWKTSFNDDSLEESDLTGHPLECHFSMDESTQSERIFTEVKRDQDEHCPLNPSIARRILTPFNLSSHLEVPVFVLTDGLDKSRTILLGSARKDGWYIRSEAKVEDFSLDPNKMTSVEKMIENHDQISSMKNIRTNSEVHAKYIIESKSELDTTFLKNPSDRIEVNLSWKTPTFTIPLNETSVEITIDSCISNEESEISHLWDQLTLLYDYLEMIKACKSDMSAKGPYSRHSVELPRLEPDEIPKKPMKDILTQLLLEANQITGISLTGRNVNFEKKTLEQIVKVITSEKKEQEFTDRLWNLLIGTSSYEEIRSCFEIVCQYVRNGTSKPYIKTTNITRLAHVLRICQNNPSHSELTLESLELLVEIGIEKLKKEYISVYLLAKIATSEQLCIPSLPKFPEVNASDWIDHCSKWITWLTRVHIVLQLMLVIENVMKSKTCIIPLTTLTLKRYLGEKSPVLEVPNPRSITSQSFTTPVNTRDLQDFLNNRRKTMFNSWTLKLSSTMPNREVISIYHRNMDEIFPSFVALIGDFNEEKNTSTNLATYYCYDFHSFSNKFF